MARQLRHYAASKAADCHDEVSFYYTTTVTVHATPLSPVIPMRFSNIFMRFIEKRSAANNDLYLAKGYPRIRITNDGLNRHKLLLNTPSGVIDLTNANLLQHNSSLLMTQCTNAIYVTNYRNEFVENTIRQILPAEETREIFLLFLRYVITGLIKEEKSAFLKYIKALDSVPNMTDNTIVDAIKKIAEIDH